MILERDRILWWILGLCITIVIGVSGALVSQVSDIHNRLYMLEAKTTTWENRLERIEGKIDRLVEKSK